MLRERRAQRGGQIGHAFPGVHAHAVTPVQHLFGAVRRLPERDESRREFVVREREQILEDGRGHGGAATAILRRETAGSKAAIGIEYCLPCTGLAAKVFRAMLAFDRPFMKLSIVIPFFNEEENAEMVLREARAAQPDAEIIAVNDGSTDRTPEIIAGLPGIRLITFPRNLGQSAALYAGIINATGDFIVPMDGDGQNDPADIQHLLARRDEFDVVCGYRRERKDALSIRLRRRSRIARASFSRTTAFVTPAVR